jgi:hypothetical protein
MNVPVIAGYRIDALIGAGSMGRVFAAEDLTLGRRVAIKLLGPAVAADDEMVARFEREARTLASIEHPAIVRVYSFARTGTSAYLVMEHIDGETLAQRLARVGRIDTCQALAIVKAVAEGLQVGWQQAIVHRDIKPSNILLDQQCGVHVADFGLAKSLDGASAAVMTQTGITLGTPHYIAPEQASGGEINFRSDIYSLGVVLFEMVTGRKPFEGTTPAGVIAQHLRDPIPPLPSVIEQSCPGLTNLVQWMTAKRAADRPESYVQLIERVAAISARRFAAPRTFSPARVSMLIAAGLVIVVGLTYLMMSGRTDSANGGVTEIESVSKPVAARVVGGTVVGGYEYRGVPISLSMKDADIRSILKTFAEVAGLNMVIDNDVHGRWTADFVKVPWDAAFEVLCQQNGLTWVMEGNVIRVARLDTLLDQKEKERRLRELTERRPGTAR